MEGLLQIIHHNTVFLRECSLCLRPPDVETRSSPSPLIISTSACGRLEAYFFFKCTGRSKIKTNIYITRKNDRGKTGNLVTLCLPIAMLK